MDPQNQQQPQGQSQQMPTPPSPPTATPVSQGTQHTQMQPPMGGYMDPQAQAVPQAQAQAAQQAQGGFPQGAYPQGPQGAYPQGTYQQGMPPMPPQQPEPEDTTPANFQLGAKLPPKLNVKVPEHNLDFDEEYFIRLLASSISLSREEKKRIVEAIPKLRQAQVDELIKIFEEEKQKFAALSKKHVPQLEKLAQQHFNDWMDLELEYQQVNKKQEDQQKADEIRKKLGL